MFFLSNSPQRNRVISSAERHYLELTFNGQHVRSRKVREVSAQNERLKTRTDRLGECAVAFDSH